MSDRIVVMNEGRIEQIGTPFEIYNYPRTRFVASFVGTLNILQGAVAGAGRIAVDGQEIIAGAGLNGSQPGDTVTVALRPEAITLTDAGPDRNRLTGTIEEVSFLGSVVRVRVRFADNAVSLDMFNDPAAAPPERGQPATVSFGHRDLQVLHDA